MFIENNDTTQTDCHINSEWNIMCYDLANIPWKQYSYAT